MGPFPGRVMRPRLLPKGLLGLLSRRRLLLLESLVKTARKPPLMVLQVLRNVPCCRAAKALICNNNLACLLLRAESPLSRLPRCLLAWPHLLRVSTPMGLRVLTCCRKECSLPRSLLRLALGGTLGRGLGNLRVRSRYRVRVLASRRCCLRRALSSPRCRYLRRRPRACRLCKWVLSRL